MAIKRKIVECECGEHFDESKKGDITGHLLYTPWKCKDNRIRGTKTAYNCDIAQCFFERIAACGKCKKEMFVDKKQYEITPPVEKDSQQPISMMGEKELIYSKE